MFGKHEKPHKSPERKEKPMIPEETKRRPTQVPKKPPISHAPYQKLVKPTGPIPSKVGYSKPAPKVRKITVAKDIVEKLTENIISPEMSGIVFSDIKGQKEIKKAIQDNIILPLMNPELFSGIRKPSRAILLYGPPGNGKTLLAKALAGQIKRTFFNISASSLMSKFLGEGEKMMRGLFTLAEEIGPSIIFFDEIDSILSSRGSGEHEASRRMKTEFLVQFDGVGSSTNGDILIVAATNRPFDLDDAALRRFTKKIFVGLPDGDARWAIITNLFKDEKLYLSKSDAKYLVKLVKGYS
jgi:spastin